MLKRFFLSCSGVDLNLIKECSNGEQNKYVGIGATIFFTALMAFISCSYALYTVFDTIYTSVVFGFFWGLLIFNLDRFIVSTLRKKERFINEFVQVLPRLLLAIIIAVVISKPLELKIFEKEINQVLLTEQNQMTLDNKNQIALQFQPEINEINNNINNLKSEIKTKEAETEKLYEIYIAEAEGRKGTKLLGKGPVYKEKREKHDKSLVELNQLKKQNTEKIDNYEKEIANLIQRQKNSEINTQPIIKNYNGLMARITALNKLPLLSSLFIFLLFLAIETAPIFTKLISSKGEYDFRLENLESAIKIKMQQQINERREILKTHTTLNKAIYKGLEDEEELYDYKQKLAHNLIKFQAESFYKNEQKTV